MSQKKHKKLRQLTEKTIEQETTPEIKTLSEDRSFLGLVKRNWIFLLVLILGIAGVYLNSLHGNFVSDDYASISQNPQIGDASLAFKGFNLVNISNYLIDATFGNTDPVFYHSFSLIIYIIFTFLSFVFVDLIFGDVVAMLTTAIFAVHPIHVEAVSWISGKPYILFPMFALGFFIAFILYNRTRKKIYLYIIGLTLALAFFADKVRFFSLVLLLILYLITYGQEILKKFNLKLIIGGALAALVIVVIVIWPNIMARVGNVNSGYNASESIFYNPFFQYPTSIAKYLQLLAFPIDLTLYHTMYVFPTLLNWMITLTYLAMLGYFFFKRKDLFFALSFIFLATAPSMAPVKVSWLVAERYIFFGSLGFCLFVAILMNDLSRKMKLAAAAILILILSTGIARTYMRNIDWQTNHNLWVNTVEVSPNSHNAWNNIGDDYDKLKQYNNAIKGFTQSTVVKPNYADAYHNRANIYFKIGRLDLARDSYMTALYYSPALYQSYFSLTQIDLNEGKFQQAINDATGAVKLQQNNPQAWYVLAVVYAQAGYLDEANKAAANCLQLAPQYKPAIDLTAQIKQLQSQKK